MRRLKLEKVIHEDFKDLGARDPQGGGEALAKLSSDLDQLDARGKITESALKGLVWNNSASQQRIAEVVRISLSTQESIRGRSTSIHIFEPGASAIVMKADGSEVMAVHHNPNSNPKLESYGNQLRWALQHAAYAAIAGAQEATSPATHRGYLAVENAIRISRGQKPVRSISDVPPKSRHHLGGHWRTDRSSTKDAIGPVVSATSGVLLSPYYLGKVRDQSVDVQIGSSYVGAVCEDLLGDFDGNFLAGLNDTKVSINLLNGVFGGGIYPIDLNVMMDMENGLDAINLH